MDTVGEGRNERNREGNINIYTLKSESHSMVSDSLQPPGLQPTRLFRPCDFPGKSTGVGSHCVLHCGLLLLLLSRFGRVQLCATPYTAVHQLPCPWDSPGKSTGVGCHCLLHCGSRVLNHSDILKSIILTHFINVEQISRMYQALLSHKYARE